MYINPQKCTNCGLCLNRCPANGAVLQGFSKNNIPFYVISKEKCLYLKDKSCCICRDECPEKAIDLEEKEFEYSCEADAILLTSGFEPFAPVGKPYGFGVFKNVITGLELERMIKRTGCVKKPSDHMPPKRMAFIQCVGSRDSKLNHLWCSKVCCGSALRMARLIKERQPDTDIAFFYMDVQTFGKDFEQFYEDVQKEVEMIRAIPGDIYETGDQRLKVNYMDNQTHHTLEEIFDLVVLSIGITPGQDIKMISGLLGIEPDNTGFVKIDDQRAKNFPDGVFTAGTVQGPMSIGETIASAGSAAWEITQYFGMNLSLKRQI